jgi:putative FmdB family regulatory protein
MPVYELACDTCAKVQEISLKFSDPKPENCPESYSQGDGAVVPCTGKLKLIFSKGSFILKGGGWPGKAIRRSKD